MTEDDDWPTPLDGHCEDCGTEVEFYFGATPLCFPCNCKRRGCTVVQKNPFHNRHYHCGNCMSPDQTSYQGHYGSRDGKTWGFSCEEDKDVHLQVVSEG